MFDDNVLLEVAVEAKAHGIDLAALLAVVEVESGGKAFEPADPRVPCFLFERHVFYRQLRAIAPDKLQAAIDAGLAIPAWDRAHQYRDEGRSADRLALLARARAIHSEAANRSCSWGVGQTMGFLNKELGFSSATEMVAFLVKGGVSAQVDLMIREVKRKGLDKALNAKNWPAFAAGYNGPGFRANQYDIKLDAAERRWRPKAAEIERRATTVGSAHQPVPKQPAPGTAPLPAPKPVEPGVWQRLAKVLGDLFGHSHDLPPPGSTP